MAQACDTGENRQVRALLIAGSANAGGNVIPRKKSDKSAKGNLDGTVSDITTMYRTLMKTTGVYIPKLYSDTDPKTTNKEAVLGSIKELFDDKKRKGFILYYSGHGQKDTGNWCFEGKRKIMADDGVIKEEYVIREYISLNDIMKLWNNREKNDSFEQWLFIIADCCYSGAWVNILKNDLKPHNIQMQAACGHNELSVDSLEGGMFTLQFKSRVFYKPSSTTNLFLSVSTRLIGFALGSIIGVPISLVAYGYHSLATSFSPVYYTPGDTFATSPTTYTFLSEDKETHYFFTMQSSFTGMTFRYCVTTGMWISTIGIVGEL